MSAALIENLDGFSRPVNSGVRQHGEQATRMLRTISILGFMIMIAGLVGLYATGALFSTNPVAVVLQAGAIGLMIWARVTFGRRSFHASAGPTAGGLVTTGPYRFIRHPIYTSACLFGVGGVVGHVSGRALLLAGLMLIGALVRIACEERLLKEKDP